ncbi:MAG: helix-hairpin-helix domain-containing protein [Dysgonomonas sp.]
MNWKDYLYFQKGDKIAILLLIILIVLTGGILLIMKGIQSGQPIVYLDKIDDFERFQEQLVDRETADQETVRMSKAANYHLYPYQEKLKKGETIELNKADTSSLKKIPGIGIGYANRIVKYRNLLGGYVSLSQLKEVYGLDDDLYEKITPYITIGGGVRKIEINTISFDDLKRHPYINYKQASIIVDLRERKGKIDSFDRLALLDEFSDHDIERLKYYLSFD